MNLQHQLRLHLQQRFYFPTPCAMSLLSHSYGEKLRLDCCTPADADWMASSFYDRLVRAAQRLEVKWVGVSSQGELYHRFLADTAEPFQHSEF